LTELQAALLELERRKRDEKLRYFVPNGAQARWIAEISRPGAFIVINAGGNGSGKTYGLVAMLGAFMFPSIAPPCFSAPIFKNFAGPKKIWVVSNPSELGDTSAIQAAIDELWPKGMYRADKKSKPYLSQFSTDTGWKLEMKSTEQHEREFRGSNIGIVAVNEPIPEKIWRECVARTRKGGIITGALTSLNDEPWMVEGLLGKHDGNDYRIIYGDVEDNCKDHSATGTLEHSQIEKILSKYPEDEQEARRTGKPLSLSGRIYKTFDREVHVAKQDIAVPDKASHYMVVDPALGKPLAVIYAFVAPDQSVTIYDEWPNTYEFQGAKDDGKDTKAYAALFRQIEAQHGVGSITRILDRHFGNHRRTLGHDALTLKQEFDKEGIEFMDSYAMDEEVETGIRKVKDFLAYDKTKELSALNRPRLTISPKCKNTIAAFEKWGRNPDTRKPKEEFKDFADVVRYLLMANPEYEIPSQWPSDVPRPYYTVS
jgi:hypothetical protein